MFYIVMAARSFGNKMQSKSTDGKVLVIGLGQIGYHNAEYMTKCGLHVDGFDISEKAVKRAIEDGVIKGSTKDFYGYDQYIVSISTHLPSDMFVPYLDGIIEVAEKLAREGKKNALVSLESTITVGTTKRILEILQHKMHVVHAPHRFYINEKEQHGINQSRVIGGCDSCCTELGLDFYKGMLGIPMHPVSDIKLAELSKIVENSYRFLQIAFAEELKIFCDNAGLDFNELRQAVNSKWNVQVLEPRDGIGGHCLPKDSQMFLNAERGMLDNSIIKAAKLVDHEYRKHMSRVDNMNQMQAKIQASQGKSPQDSARTSGGYT